MKSKNDEKTQRILILLKLDANNLFRRVTERKIDYLGIFSLRRTRDHFPQIFRNRYETTSISDLSCCSTELITTLDQFYSLAEEMNWYLFQTKDMPNTVEDFISHKIRKMEKILATLNLYLDAELGIVSQSTGHEVTERTLTNIVLEESFSDVLKDDIPQES